MLLSCNFKHCVWSVTDLLHGSKNEVQDWAESSTLPSASRTSPSLNSPPVSGSRWVYSCRIWCCSAGSCRETCPLKSSRTRRTESCTVWSWQTAYDSSARADRRESAQTMKEWTAARLNLVFRWRPKYQFCLMEFWNGGNISEFFLVCVWDLLSRWVHFVHRQLLK